MHRPIIVDDQKGGGGEQHVVQPEANKEQPIDKEPLREADYMRIIDNITVNTIDISKGFGTVLCQYFPLIICLCYQPKYHFSPFSGRLFYMVSENCPLSAQELGYRTQA